MDDTRPESAELDTEALSDDDLCQKILHVLSIYPCISFSMLRVGVGTNIIGSKVRRHLEDLIMLGKVAHKVESKLAPNGRTQTYDLYSLGSEPVTG